MDPQELQGRYQCLRQELAVAYAATQWDSQRIDRIADEMLPLERVLSTLHAARPIDPVHRHATA